MVSLNYTAPAAVAQTPPIVAELQALFDNTPDSELLSQLRDSTRRGPKGYSVQALWHTFLTKHYMGLPSTRAIIRTLSNNPWIANVCGFDWPDIPHEATFSRFFKRLSTPKFLPRVKDVSRSLVRRCYDELPGFGERVAIDSTTLKAWSNGGKDPYSDPDAGRSIKKNTHGKNEFVYGYKLYLLVDSEYELPIAANVSAGNIHDVKRASNLLAEARRQVSRFHPSYFLADAGYSSRKLLHLLRRQYSIKPIIQINRGHKRLRQEFGEAMKTPEWKALYTQRQAVERVNSRLKGQRSVNDITTRRWRKATLHCYLSLIAMQACSIHQT